jgi:hypothetical protein
MGSDEYAWYSVMLDGMGKTKGAGIHEGVGQTAAAHTRLQQYHALAAHVAGESAIALAARGRRVTEYKEKGAPVDYRLFDPYPGSPTLWH